MSIKKVVVTGPESTGKSTLSQALAKTYNTVWVPEYARDYLEQLGRDYVQEDLVQIARGQVLSEDAHYDKANGILICDTDCYVIKVWSEYKYQSCDPAILQLIAERQYDLYLLCNIDIPWKEDPLRETPDEGERRKLFRTYHDIVLNTGVAFELIQGNEAERLAIAQKAINKLIPN